jgi:hypothetical protein
MATPKKTLSLTIPRETYELAQQRATREGRTLSNYVAWVLAAAVRAPSGEARQQEDDRDV